MTKEELRELAKNYVELQKEVKESIEEGRFDRELGRTAGETAYKFQENIYQIMENVEKDLFISSLTTFGIGTFIREIKKPEKLTPLFNEAFPLDSETLCISDSMFIKVMHTYSKNDKEWPSRYKAFTSFYKTVNGFHGNPNKKQLKNLAEKTPDYVIGLIYETFREKRYNSIFPYIPLCCISLLTKKFDENRLEVIQDFIVNCNDIYLLQSLGTQIFPDADAGYEKLKDIIMEKVNSMLAGAFTIKLFKEAGIETSWNSQPEISFILYDEEDNYSVELANRYKQDEKGTYKNEFQVHIKTEKGQSHFVPHPLEKNAHSISVREKIEPGEIREYLSQIAKEADFTFSWEKLYIGGVDKRVDKKLKKYLLKTP